MKTWSDLSTQRFKFGPRDSSLNEVFGPAAVKRLRKKFLQPNDEVLFITLRELSRFLYLCANGPSSVFFPGDKLMDDLWHALIVETSYYKKLCESLNPGTFVHHSGTTFEEYLLSLPEGKIHEEQCSWLASYYSNFGPLEAHSYDCLLLVQSLCERLGVGVVKLNEFASMLLKIGLDQQAVSEPFHFQVFVDTVVRPQAAEIDVNPRVLGAVLRSLLKGLQTIGAPTPIRLTNTELEILFGASITLAFTLWQHLAAVDRLAGLPEWQVNNSKLLEKIANGDVLCGLATTHLAKPGGGSIRGADHCDGFIITGEASWVCGYQIFDKLLVGFETNKSIIFALTDYPDNSNVTSSAELLDLACLKGSATAKINFNEAHIPALSVVSRREKTSKPPTPPRTPTYVIPELGIGKAVVNEIHRIVHGSEHPRHVLAAKAVSELQKRISAIEEVRDRGGQLDELIYLRDEINRDSIRVLALATGADSLSSQSLVARISLGLLLLDVVVQSPAIFERKMLSSSQGAK